MTIVTIVTVVTIVLLVALLAAAPGWTQEAGTPADEASARETPDETVESSTDDELVELDERSYADTEEEDFVPSEDIPTDQAIAFPTDI